MRRISMSLPTFQTAPRPTAAYSAETDETERAATVEAELGEQPKKLWDTLKPDSLRWLDASVALLTLGNQGIVRPELLAARL